MENKQVETPKKNNSYYKHKFKTILEIYDPEDNWKLIDTYEVNTSTQAYDIYINTEVGKKNPYSIKTFRNYRYPSQQLKLTRKRLPFGLSREPVDE
jgi:hypothetical protein